VDFKIVWFVEGDFICPENVDSTSDSSEGSCKYVALGSSLVDWSWDKEGGGEKCCFFYFSHNVN
jgi:hypothetical protein